MMQIPVACFVTSLFIAAYFGVGGLMVFTLYRAGASFIDMLRYFFLWPLAPGGMTAKRLDDEEDKS